MALLVVSRRLGRRLSYFLGDHDRECGEGLGVKIFCWKGAVYEVVLCRVMGMLCSILYSTQHYMACTVLL